MGSSRFGSVPDYTKRSSGFGHFVTSYGGNTRRRPKSCTRSEVSEMLVFCSYNWTFASSFTNRPPSQPVNPHLVLLSCSCPRTISTKRQDLQYIPGIRSSMSYPNQVFTSFAFLGFLLCAIPLPWHLEGRRRVLHIILFLDLTI